MAKFELKLPKMGESVAEATLTTWLKEVGDIIEMDDPVVEIATDKVDSEVPSEVAGTLIEKLFEINDIVQVGQTIAIIEVEGAGEENDMPVGQQEENSIETEDMPLAAHELENEVKEATEKISGQKTAEKQEYGEGSKFYSPLVKNIAVSEKIPLHELESISGTGKEGRVTKNDILQYIKNKKEGSVPTATKDIAAPSKAGSIQKPLSQKVTAVASGEDEIIEMTRMGKMVAQHMVASVQTSAHVQSFIEVDVTTIWNWRNKIKDEFQKREGEKLTFTPIFMQAVAKTIKDFPMVNISLSGNTVIKKKNINLGMAAALPDGNLIVPVIKNADQLNLVGMTKKVNDLANRAKNKQLNPDDTQGGTYTVTNVGTFGSIMGTPIINQPQVAILALGAIRKVPAVIETPEGDFIGIRYKMFLSHSYDHRVVNGALGGQFIQRVKEYLEAFDGDREF